MSPYRTQAHCAIPRNVQSCMHGVLAKIIGRPRKTRVIAMEPQLKKRRKYSKKSKKNLRKYTDIHDVEEFLEEQRFQERTG